MRRPVVPSRAVCRIDCLELAIFHQRLQLAGIEQFGLFDQALDHDLGGSLHLLPDEADHGDIALDLDVLADVQAFWRGGGTKFPGLGRLAGLVAADLPFVAHVDIGRRVRVSLQAEGQVVEDAAELDGAAA